MSDAAEMHARHRRQLAQIAAWGMELLDQMQADAKAAEPAERAELALKFHRVSRGVRQCMALEARLERERERCARDAAHAAEAHDQPQARRAPLGSVAYARRREQVRTALMRMAWTEAERPDTEDAPEDPAAFAASLFAYFRDDIDGVLTEDGLNGNFCAESLDEHVERLAVSLAYPPDLIARWRSLPDPPPAALAAQVPPADPDPESSA
jgi:hypothetical protein